jgi:single-stranded-DNA-specific exonuclease
MTGTLLNEIQRLAPFGEGNREPVFIGENLEIAGKPKIMGKAGNHISFMCKSDPYTFKTVFFGGARHAEKLSSHTTFAYTPVINTHLGSTQIELHVTKIF